MGTKTQKQKTPPITETTIGTKTFIGIDFHKKYSVYHVLDEAGKDVTKGRIDHATPEEFGKLLMRFPGCRVAFEATMNWHWLFVSVTPSAVELRWRYMVARV